MKPYLLFCIGFVMLGCGSEPAPSSGSDGVGGHGGHGGHGGEKGGGGQGGHAVQACGGGEGQGFDACDDPLPISDNEVAPFATIADVFPFLSALDTSGNAYASAYTDSQKTVVNYDGSKVFDLPKSPSGNSFSLKLGPAGEFLELELGTVDRAFHSSGISLALEFIKPKPDDPPSTSTQRVHGFDVSGEETWTFDVPKLMHVSAMALDSAGNALLAGGFIGALELAGKTFTPTDQDGIVVQLSSSGEPRWAYVFPGPRRGSFADVGVDADDHVYAVGSTDEGGAGITSASSVIVRLDPNGNEAWKKIYPRRQGSGASTLAVDRCGTSVLFADPTGVRELDASGTETQHREVPGSLLASIAPGKWLITGQSTVTSLTSDGQVCTLYEAGNVVFGPALLAGRNAIVVSGAFTGDEAMIGDVALKDPTPGVPDLTAFVARLPLGGD